MESKDFYVYLHRRLTDRKIFYVGKGSGKRAWSLSGRSMYWQSIVNKHGLKVEIIQDGMQEWWAFEMECALIAFYGRDFLCNMTDGGEGISGCQRSKETKLKMSVAKKAKNYLFLTSKK